MEGRHSQVHENAVHASARTELLLNGRTDVVVSGVDRAETRPEALEACRGQLDGLGVTVNADDGEPLETLKSSLRVSAHAQRSIHEDGTGALNRRGEHVEALA